MILFDCKLKKVFIRPGPDGLKIFLMIINKQIPFNYLATDKK